LVSFRLSKTYLGEFVVKLIRCFSWNFYVGRLVVLRLLLLAVGLAQELRVILFAKLQETVQAMHHDETVKVDENHDESHNAVAYRVVLGVHEEPNAQRDVNENVESRQQQIGNEQVLLLLQGAYDERKTSHQIQKVDCQEARQED
jgi:hypothetical protein